VREEFSQAINTHQTAFGLDLSDQVIARLADYYELVQEHNPLLHLVGPCSPEEFVIRHILESLTLLEHLPNGAKFADVGAGAGLPSIPCLLVRKDLKAVLIESKEKKAKFLDLAVETLDISTQANVVNKQFQEVDLMDCQAVTCRALDKFTEKLPRLLKWAGQRKLLFFGGDNLQKRLNQCKIAVDTKRMPLSEKRYLFIGIGKSQRR
jgi:16S rRNA (guanine(527)-N(7))-methyltransferase RsmG